MYQKKQKKMILNKTVDLSKQLIKVHDIKFRYIEDPQTMLKKIKHFDLLMTDDMEKQINDTQERILDRINLYTVDRVN